MNRRTFAITAAASLALAGNSALAQRSRSSATVVTSELTSAEIDLADTGWVIGDHTFDERDGWERFQINLDRGLIYLVFSPHGSGDHKQTLVQVAEDAEREFPNFTLLGEDDFDDGGWMSFSHDIQRIHYLHYHEYQLQAFPDYDLVVMFSVPAEDFAAELELMQTVQIEGMPPFLFTEDSDIYGIATSTQNQSSGTGNRRGQRSQSSGTSQSNQRTDSRTTAPKADPVETVQSHRTQFNSSFDEFYEVLEVAADETTSSSDILASWDAMLAIASDWQQYPVDAATVSFSRNQTDLEDAYLHWADCVADLGASFDQFYANTATVDDFLVVYDVLLIADSELGSVLRSYNSRSSVIRNRTSAIATSMKSVASSRLVLA